MVARALQHALAKGYLELPTVVEWLEGEQYRLIGTTVYFDLMERLGAEGVVDKASPDSKISLGVAHWLEQTPKSALPAVQKLLHIESGQPEHRDNAALSEVIRTLFPAA
ncbi:hypothetical protein HRUBRA_02785 [Pseudohaliea rubra DSM 19751]|uniref:Uncharacterized protein n=2 Tax=Pseudohaliea TaxID=1341120 RepID=A0A095VMG7_9GAMM|nr:hypothetical protein HRUBRA_02785 [Pseudohaliea rubra DSM 19751]